MTLTAQVKRIVAWEIRPYILPLPFCDYNDPAMVAGKCSDEEWRRWLGCWASCYIPLRIVCKEFRCLHLGELLVGNLRRSCEALTRVRTPEEIQVAEACMRKFWM